MNEVQKNAIREADNYLKAAGLPTYSSITTSQPALAVPSLSKDQIREVFLAHGFTIKEGHTDLKPYVYDAADALLKLANGGPDA